MHQSKTFLIIKGHNLAAAICYEVAYPNLTRRNAVNSGLLVTEHNDAWFTGAAGHTTSSNGVVPRKMDVGLFVLPMQGVTAFIDHNGHI